MVKDTVPSSAVYDDPAITGSVPALKMPFPLTSIARKTKVVSFSSSPDPEPCNTRSVTTIDSTLEADSWICIISTVCSSAAMKPSGGLAGPRLRFRPPGAPLVTMVTVAPSSGNAPPGRSGWVDDMPSAVTCVASASRAPNVAPIGAVPFSE